MSEECCNSEEYLTPEEDIEIFKSACREGDFKHALFHLACALASDPLNRVWLGYLDELSDSQPDLLKYVPIEENNYFAVMAVRAYLLAKTGQYNPAFRILGQVLSVKPDIPYLGWFKDWASTINRMKELKPEVIISFMGAAVAAVDRLTAPLFQETLINLESFLRMLCQSYPEEYLLFWSLSAIQRRLQQYQAALANAETAYQIKRCWQTAIGIALVYREEQKVSEAAFYYEEAIRMEPQEVTSYLDLGDMLLESGAYQQALGAYQRGLNIDPNNYWAQPSLLYCEYLLSPSDQSLQKLKSYHETHPDNPRITALLTHIQSCSLKAYWDYIPEPCEAIINILRQIAAEHETLEGGGTIKLSLSHPEAPSSILAFNLYLSNFGRIENPSQLQISIGQIPQPDPRIPWKNNLKLLWNFEDCALDNWNFKPALSSPPPLVLDAVRSLAVNEYQLETWYEKAAEIGGQFGPDYIEEFLAAMIYISEPPETFSSWRWVQQVQYAAVFILAHLEKEYPSKILEQICYGQSDWPIEAAITILAYQATIHPEIETKVQMIFNDLLNQMPDQGYCFYSYALVCNWLNLKSISPEFREELKEWKAHLENPEES